jgi:hypothetical protein
MEFRPSNAIQIAGRQNRGETFDNVLDSFHATHGQS